SPHFLRNFRASSSVASSAAALVGERVIVPHQRNSQQGFSEKIENKFLAPTIGPPGSLRLNT
ncbi:hypothetical protein, partial [Rhizobium sp. Root1212]|uniref:hypothetical protein n=1 Tax=Rhizobium sp. Root1212 TaxID=1736429 RepID=UPI001AEC950E